MFRKIMLAAAFVYAVGAVNHYADYANTLSNNGAKQLVVPEKIAAGIAASMWPLMQDWGIDLPGVSLSGIDFSSMDATQLVWLYLLACYGVLGIPAARWACRDQIADYQAKGKDGRAKDGTPLIVVACYAAAPVSVPLVGVWWGVCRKVEPAPAKSCCVSSK